MLSTHASFSYIFHEIFDQYPNMERIYISLGLSLYLLRRKEGSKRWRAVARFMRWAAVLISAARCEDGRSGGIQLGSRLPRSRDTKLVPSTPSRITCCAQQESPTLDTSGVLNVQSILQFETDEPAYYEMSWR